MRKDPIVKQILRKLTPTQQITLSFVFVILTGGFLLSLPISNTGTPAPFIDHLFTSASAVCVTGLAVIYPGVDYTAFGQWVMIALMQIGGLGLMTLIAVFVIFLSGRLDLKSKIVMSEAVNRSDFFDFHHFIRSIIKYTVFFEGIGFLLLCYRFIPEFGWEKGTFTALFTAVSAFCNAGFDNIGTINLIPYVSDPLVSLTIAGLIIVGGLGFGVWFDLSQGSKSIIAQTHTVKYVIHHLKIHSKLAIIMTLTLIFGGMGLIFIIEYTNPQTLGNLDFGTKLLASFFQSVTTRTAGFSTINIGFLKTATLLIMMVLMFIGGSPGGTAGGIKTTTFAVLILMVAAEIRGAKDITVFNRKIEREQFRKAFVVAFALLATLMTGIILLTLSEPFSFLELSFEATSAIGTVGLSMGITQGLSDIGKSIIIALMFLGRIGPLTLVLSMSKQGTKGHELTYPKGDILIG